MKTFLKFVIQVVLKTNLMSANYLITKGVSNKMMTACSNHEFPEKFEGNKKPGARVSIKTMKSLYIGLAVITGLLFVSCRKYSPQPTAAAPTVYVAGGEQSSNNIGVATLWTNGVATNLSNGTLPASAQSVYVNGSDVYVAGNQNVNNVGIATLWKNGVATNLSNGTYNTSAVSVYVSESDV
jgi:hypothetical protein